MNNTTDSKQNDVLRKMNALLAALNEHVDAHPTCCLKTVLKSVNGDSE